MFCELADMLELFPSHFIHLNTHVDFGKIDINLQHICNKIKLFKINKFATKAVF